jgi:Lipase (class 3)
MRKLILVISFVITSIIVLSQTLQPAFNGKEYMDMLAIAFQHFDSAIINPKIPVPDNYYAVYRSPEVGLKNRWNMWYSKDNKIGVIAIRGTINELSSWLENFYAAMVPATGSLQLNDSTVFNYQLSANSKAQVHVGWTIGLGFLAPTIVQQIKIAYEKGIHEFIIVGHSQGGAMAFLTRSYLYYLTEKGALPKDIVFKTYCSGAPKPGNLYYGYDFDFITRGGWAYTVVNGADWVPETPFSIQRLSDFNAVNPFIHIDGVLKKQKLLVRWYVKGKYNKMNRTTRRAQENFEKTLGSFVYNLVKKDLPQLKQPVYVAGNNYQRAGISIILQPDADYYAKFPNETNNVFQHHLFEPYYTLAKKYYGQ